MNRVVLAGRLTANPEIRKSTNGNSVCRFSLAVNRKFKNSNGERQADFINCVAYRKTAELINQYTDKGDLLGIEGRIQTGSYTAGDGRKRYTTDVVVENIAFINSKRKNEPQAEKQTQSSEKEDIFADFGENVAIEDDFLD